MLKRIILAFLCVLLFFVVGLCLVVKNRTIHVGFIRQSYNNVSLIDKSDRISIPLYVNQSESFVTDKELIEEITLFNNTDLITCQLSSIDYLRKENINKEYYFVYKFNLIIQSIYTDKLYLNDCSMSISYSNGKEVTVDIGNISLYKKTDNLDNVLGFKNIKGIINKVGGKQILTGIAFTLSRDDVEILSITPLDNTIIFNSYNMVLYDDIEMYKDINTYIDNYTLTDYKDINDTLDIDPSSSYVLGLGYKEVLPLYTFALKIEYLYKGTLYTYFTDRICFYQSNNINIETVDFDFNTYEYY